MLKNDREPPEFLLKISQQLEYLAHNLPNNLDIAVDFITKQNGLLVTSGVGKSGIVAKKFSATLCSLGVPSAFLHPMEAAHGDSGVLTDCGALVIFSKSGNTEELQFFVDTAKLFTTNIFAICMNENSLLVDKSQFSLILPNLNEAGRYKVVPTTSFLLMTAFSDLLAVLIAEKREVSGRILSQTHRGGTIGRLAVKTVSEVMLTLDKCAVVEESDSMRKVMRE